MRYFSVLCLCLGVSGISYLIPSFDHTSPWFYVVHSSWSMIIILSIIIIEQIKLPFIPLKKWLLFGIIGVESSAVLLNFVTLYGGLTPKNLIYWHYYEHILEWLQAVEIVLLLIGAPWGGIYNTITSLWRTSTANLAYNHTFNRYNPFNKIRTQKIW